MLRRIAVLLITISMLTIAGCGDDECPACPEDDPILVLSKHKIDFGAGGTEDVFTILNRGEKTLSWQITVNNGHWLELSTMSGNNDAVINVTADRNLINEVGPARASIIISTPGAQNVIKDSIEVLIFNGAQWLLTDDNEFDSCALVDDLDWYWVKRFDIPEGLRGVIVDSISLYFCAADTVIQLLAYPATEDQDGNFGPAGIPTYVKPHGDQVFTGWNTLSADWYFSVSPFFIGYFQPGALVPRLGIDTTATDTSYSWKARNFTEFPEEPDSIDLYWVELDTNHTYGIRVFVTPVLDYNSKLSSFNSNDFFNQNKVNRLTGKSCVIRSVKPSVEM